MVAAAAPRVVVMGVSGSGKSTLAQVLAQRLVGEFLEGDDLHPPRNVERMAAGIALTDDDRRDWLLAIAQRLAAARASQRSLVVSCSALKRSYRELLRGACPDLAFVHLHASPALLDARMRARTDHFMPASLLASQLQTLEPPGSDERAITLDAALPPAQLADSAIAWVAKLAPLSSTTPSTTETRP